MTSVLVHQCSDWYVILVDWRRLERKSAPRPGFCHRANKAKINKYIKWSDCEIPSVPNVRSMATDEFYSRSTAFLISLQTRTSLFWRLHTLYSTCSETPFPRNVHRCSGTAFLFQQNRTQTFATDRPTNLIRSQPFGRGQTCRHLGGPAV